GVLPRETLEARQLLGAGLAPRGEEVQHDRLASQLRELDGAPREAGGREVGSTLAGHRRWGVVGAAGDERNRRSAQQQRTARQVHGRFYELRHVGGPLTRFG